MGFTVSVKDTLTDSGKGLSERINELKDKSVHIGFVSGKNYKVGRDGSRRDVAKIAAENEFGTPKIPSRPFMRMSADEINSKDGDDIEWYSEEYIKNGGNLDDLLEVIGKTGVEVVKRVIQTGRFKPNSPLTIALKHSDKPLIDTGTMMNSVEYEIQKKGGE